MERFPIIDTHVHFWDMRNPDPGMAWSWIGKDVDHPILGDIDAIKMLKYDINSIWAEARFADVSAFVHVQAAIGSDDPVKETRWLTRMRESDPPAPFTIIAEAALGDAGASAVLAGHAESPYFVGIRDFTAEPYLASGEVSSTYEASLAELAANQWVFDVDCEWMNMPSLVELAGRHPDLPIVLEHIGFPRERDDEYFESWRGGLQALASADNITCKISGVAMTDPRFTQESLRRWVETCLETFGPDRCVLGSNWPVDRLFSGYERIMDYYRDYASTLSESEQRRVFSENAARLYRL